VAIEVTLPAWLASQGLHQYNKRALSVPSPEDNSTVHHQKALKDAAVARAAQIAPDASPFMVGTVASKPTDPIGDLAKHGRGKLPDGREASKIFINPNADASYYAHELGHGVSQKTKAGRFINDARHKINSNPKLGKALATALAYSVPAVGAALQEGDDDLAGSIALAAAVASPTLIDEALASKNALAIMNDAGLRATMGQRGRLAGGYLSYLAPVLIAGSIGNFTGNLVDEKTALYDL